MSFGGQEILLLVLIVLLLFGASRLPKLARSMREARDEFQKGADEEASKPKPAATPPVQAQTPTPAPPVDNPPAD
jgi:sec-independent protein translocase protein TatA